MKAMRYLSLLFLTSCGFDATAPDATAPQEKIMNQIERQVRLPSGFGPISKYNRFYAADKSGRIAGIYLTASEKGLPVGQRKWLTNYAALPSAFDGGCNVINVLFDTRAEKLVSTGCNEDS